MHTRSALPLATNGTQELFMKNYSTCTVEIIYAIYEIIDATYDSIVATNDSIDATYFPIDATYPELFMEIFNVCDAT